MITWCWDIHMNTRYYFEQQSGIGQLMSMCFKRNEYSITSHVMDFHDDFHNFMLL